MIQTISKSHFKPRALEFLRMVEKEKKSLIITHDKKPVAKIIPYSDTAEKDALLLRDTVISYSSPTKPVAQADWEVLKK